MGCNRQKVSIFTARVVSDLRISANQARKIQKPFFAKRLFPDFVEIFDFSDGGDLDVCDGIIRSVLFKACLKGIDNAVFKIDDINKINKLKKLNFVKNDNKILNYLSNFMNSCKNCNKID